MTFTLFSYLTHYGLLDADYYGRIRTADTFNVI